MSVTDNFYIKNGVLVNYQGSGGDIIIPGNVKAIGDYAFCGCEVKSLTAYDNLSSIGDGAFSDCVELISVCIGKGQEQTTASLNDDEYNETEIGEGVFKGCTALKTVELGTTVKSIGKDAFADCTGLKSVFYSGSIADWCKIKFGNINANPVLFSGKISIGGDEPSNLTLTEDIGEVAAFAFAGCESLTRIMITDGAKVGESAFESCNNIKTVIISDSVSEIGDRAFASCHSLVKAVISDSAKLGKAVFADCEKLKTEQREAEPKKQETKKQEPKKVAAYNPADFEIAGGVLKKYRGKASEVVVPDGIKQIGEKAFDTCVCLRDVTIPDSVTSIGEDAFHACSNLTSITIPDSVTSINTFAFSGCSGLTSLMMGSSVASIGKHAFSGCHSLTSITVASGNRTYHSSGNCVIDTKNKTLVVGCKSSTIPTDGSVTSIGYGAFFGRDSLTSITIPRNVTSIGNDAFYWCDRLKSITFQGTTVQWKKVTKGACWDHNTGSYTIHCTDGNIKK